MLINDSILGEMDEKLTKIADKLFIDLKVCDRDDELFNVIKRGFEQGYVVGVIDKILTDHDIEVSEENEIKYLSFEEATKPEIIDFAKFIWNSAKISEWESVPCEVGFPAAVASYFNKELNRLFMCGDLYE